MILIFDIGKTNKKLFLFNEHYKIVLERSVQFAETKDEDGFPCDAIDLLSAWIKDSVNEILSMLEYDIKAINFSAYGASFVYVDEGGKTLAPLYNYLKPYPAALHDQFYRAYGGEDKLAVETASPVLGNLNSGMQVYRIKYEQPVLFEQIRFAMHLPQFISYLVTGTPASEITSIGCHTALWDFSNRMYHDWVYAEELDEKFPPVLRSHAAMEISIGDRHYKVGIGLHDSSAALIPYLACFSEPFVLISTGTWCISLNPFNDEPLTTGELKQDCLCYLEYHGKPVKASRLFAGNEHEQQTRRLATHFAVSEDHYRSVPFIPLIADKIKTGATEILTGANPSVFGDRNLDDMPTYEDAYHQLIADIIQQQKRSTSLVLSGKKVKRIFVDGGFAKNPVYMHMLAAAFPDMEVYAASVSQATAIGAALAIHSEWNSEPVPGDMVELKYYTVAK